MPTLFNTTIDYVSLLDALSNAEEMTDEQMAALMDLQGALVDKLDAYGCVIKELQHKADALKAEADRMTAWRTQVDANIRRMKQAVADSMTAVGEDKLQTANFRIAFRKNPPSTEVDEGFIEWARMNNRDDLLIFKDPEPDKTKIKDALKQGQVLPAKLVESRSLRIE